MSSKLCPFCMRMTEGDACPHCGKSINYAGSPAHLPAGYVVSGKHPYVLGAALGQGGFGITYIALDMVTNERVAIKEYYPTYCSTRTNDSTVTAYSNQEEVYLKGKERFLDEARTLKSLSDLKSIVNVLDFFEANNSAYLVMEFLEGSSLKDYAAKNGKFPAQEFLSQIRPLMEDIERMHQRGVVHRDIAPDNIMLLPDGQMKLIDFGTARSFVGDRSMTVVVKKGFAPLEQYLTKGTTPSTDVYALAATIYYCITGTVPMDSAERQYDGTPLESPSALGADITPLQEKALAKALEIQQKARTQSVQEFLDNLNKEPEKPQPEPPVMKPSSEEQKAHALPLEKEAVHVYTAPVKQEEPVRTTPEEQPKQDTKKKKPVWIAAAAVILLVLAVGYYTVHFWSTPTCTEASTCTICGKENEPALGHDWAQATCTQAKICSRCNATEGTALGHKWKAATCTQAKTCSRCNVTEGKVLEHNWKAATCTDAKKCKVCNTTEGKALGHNWKAATYDTPKTCSRCNKKEGNVKGYVGTVSGYYNGETYVRSYRKTSVYKLNQKLENCRKFTLNYTISKVNYGSVYGRFEVFVHTGENAWNWESVGMIEVSEDKGSVSTTFELDQGVSFDAISVFCQAYGSYSYSSYLTVTDAQVY